MVAFVGKLVRAFIDKAFNRLGDNMTALLFAMLQRLRTAKTLTLIQSLVVVFAQLLQTHADAMMQFLRESNSLEFLIKTWCDQGDSFYGSFDCKLSALGLGVLIARFNPLLASIIVKGREIETQGIRTRSKMRGREPQYEMIPATVKIIQMLAAEYGSVLERSKAAGAGADDDDIENASDDDDDAEEWEDEDASQPTLSRKSPFADAHLLSDMIDLGLCAGYGSDADGEDDDDSDDKSHPLYSVDLKAFLDQTFATLSHDPAMAAISGNLTPEELRTIQAALHSQQK